MTSAEFVIWMKGFMAACNDFTATPAQWDKIKEVLENVQDYDDNPGLDDWRSWNETEQEGSISLSGSTSTNVLNHLMTDSSTTVWNDKMGTWHYTNYPEGFGYYTNSTIEETNKKQQLND